MARDDRSAIADQIRDLTTRVQGDLIRAANYYDHTREAWRLIRSLVAEGRPIQFVSADTGDQVDGPTLAGLSHAYITGYLAESVFGQYVALLEDYTFGLIGCWLLAYPKGIFGLDDDESDDRLKQTDKTVPLSFITDYPDRESILRAVIDRELDRLKYRRLAAWFDYLEKRAHLGAPTMDQIGQLAEIKAARDILVHHRGIANETYLAKSGSQARYAAGERVEIIDPYLRTCWLLIHEVIRELSARAIAKLEKSPPGDPIPVPGS